MILVFVVFMLCSLFVVVIEIGMERKRGAWEREREKQEAVLTAHHHMRVGMCVCVCVCFGFVGLVVVRAWCCFLCEYPRHAVSLARFDPPL
jgi:hypothetical protein